MAFEYKDGVTLTRKVIESAIAWGGAVLAAEGKIPNGLLGGLTAAVTGKTLLMEELFGKADGGNETVHLSYGQYGQTCLRALDRFKEEYGAFVEGLSDETLDKDDVVGHALVGVMAVLGLAARELFSAEKEAPEEKNEEEHNEEPSDEGD